MNIKSFSKLSLVLILALSFSFSQAQKYDLKLQLEKGKTYQVIQKAEKNVGLTVMGMDQGTESTETYEYTLKVLDVQEGVYDMEVTYDAIASTTKSPQGEMSYDSKSDSVGSDQVAQMMEPMIGESFSMKVNEMGEVIEVTGGKEIMEKAISNMEGITDEQRAMIEQTMEKQVGSDALTNSMATLFSAFPSKKVKAGKTWKDSKTVSSVGTLLIETVYTLDKVEDGKAYVSYKSEATPGEGEPQEMMGMTMEFDLEGVYNGSFVMDVESGWLLEKNVDQDLGGELKMEHPAMGVMNAPMTFQGNVQVTSGK